MLATFCADQLRIVIQPKRKDVKLTYIFVGGSQRTGTSIAQQLLCQLPEANPYLLEAGFLSSLVRCYAEARSRFDESEKCYFGTVQNLRDFQSGVVHAFLEGLKQRLGGPEHLILKEPHLTIYWPYLFELVPEARFLMMVRDPRDAIASMVTVGEKQKRLGQNYLFVDRDIPALCRHFLSFYEPAFGLETPQFRKQLGVVHYEELVSNPQQTLRDISRFSGVSFERIDVLSQPNSGHVDYNELKSKDLFSPWATQVSGEGLSKSRVGNYVNVLTPLEITQVEHGCHEFFRWFGYRQHAA